jgi:RsiW-degrading membrane proteinase PrsW (M82 family)
MTKPQRSVASTLNTFTHTDRFQLADVLQIFQRVFIRHDVDEVEAQFGVGLPSTTPPIAAVEDRVARPWFFSRALLFFGLGFIAVLGTYRATGNPNLIPALVFMGSFAGPIAVAIFFFECNLPANISLYAVFRMFIWGGILGIVLTLALSTLEGILATRWLGASVAALTEEPAKLAAVVLLASRRKCPWTLNGLCLGAAVGAGFAAFESAGYALRGFLEVLMESNVSEANTALIDVMTTRGFQSPFTHVVWTAITAGALWRVVHDSPLRSSSLADWRFVSPFIASVLLHFTWNSPLLWSLPYAAKPIFLGAISWTIAFGLLFTGFREVREAAALARPNG